MTQIPQSDLFSPLTLEIRTHTPKFNQFIRDHQCMIPWSFIKIGKEVWAVSCTKEWFWLMTFRPLVTLKIRSHGSKSNQFLRHSKGGIPTKFYQHWQSSFCPNEYTRNVTDGQTDRRTVQKLHVSPRGGNISKNCIVLGEVKQIYHQYKSPSQSKSDSSHQ